MVPAMPLNLTRKELYDLVWAKPRTEIAKQFEISSVRLGKLCREMNVPAPPRGYWANLAGRRRKRKYIKPPLTYNVAERIEEEPAVGWASFPDFDPKKFDQDVPPPPDMPYSLEETVERYRLLAYQAPMPKATRGAHPITQKLITEDERRATLAWQSSWEKPKFESPEGKELLQGLNQLLWMWTDLGFKTRSIGYRDISLRIGRGGYPPRQNSCRPDRIDESGGDDERTRWLDTDKDSRTGQWRGCCRRSARRWTMWRGNSGLGSRRWSAGAVRGWESRRGSECGAQRRDWTRW